MQPVDFTTLSAVVAEVRGRWVPARFEGVRQDDYQTVLLQLRTMKGSGWLVASCHPQAARLHFGEAPRGKGNRLPFATALYQSLSGRVLVECTQPAWERVVRLGFARRPDDAAELTLHLEIMGKYSNLVLTDREGSILALAHSVSAAQSRVRPLQIGESYQPPPPLVGPAPSLDESFAAWRDRLAVVGEPLATALLRSYRGVSKVLVQQMLTEAHLPAARTDGLGEQEWLRVYRLWCAWLTCLRDAKFQPGTTRDGGYTVVGLNLERPERDLMRLLDRYYGTAVAGEALRNRRQRLAQVLRSALGKARKRLADFDRMAAGAQQAEEHKRRADLLMAHLSADEPGRREIVLADFETGAPVTIVLDPAKDLVANAQEYYRRHRKGRRATQTLAPLREQAAQEVAYLEQVSATVDLLDGPGDVDALAEVEEELREQGYLAREGRPATAQAPVEFHRFALPGGRVVLVGRNNRQNDRLTFEVAGADDLWFHAQEIPGSHVVLRVGSGAVPEPSEVQWAANLAAHFSQARGSAHVPVVYTERRHVRKLKGGRPGLVTFQRERVTWGRPDELPGPPEG